MSCSTRMMVTPRSRMRVINSSSSSVSCGFMPAAGSSSSSSRGWVASARAISSRAGRHKEGPTPSRRACRQARRIPRASSADVRMARSWLASMNGSWSAAARNALPHRGKQAAMLADHHCFQHGQMGKQPNVLESAGNAPKRSPGRRACRASARPRIGFRRNRPAALR